VGFYIRKSVSAGPFRFNLSRSGVGVSVGVKGFRVGSGPRGNYMHMGRGGLYYRASLGGAHRRPSRPTDAPAPVPLGPSGGWRDGSRSVETGNILEMVPSNGSDIVQQINERMARVRFWPWVLGGGLLIAALLAAQPNAQPFALALIIFTAALSIFLARIDIQRKTVVILYDCLRMRWPRSRHLARSSISSRLPQKSGSLIRQVGHTIGSAMPAQAA
jgi:hypothetical protein